MPRDIVVRENTKNEYQIVLRNTSVFDIAIKIVNRNSAIKLERIDALVLAHRYTPIKIVEIGSRDAISKGAKPDITIYARAIYPFNRKNVRQWIEGSITDKPHHITGTFNFLCDDAGFSPKKIVVDVPGDACMIEATGYAIKMKHRKDILRIFLEHDTNAATQLDTTSIHTICGSEASNKQVKSGVNNTAEDSCFLMPLWKSLCNAGTKIEPVQMN